MANVTRHVIVLCHDFPPNSGIGGRRWGLLARGMADRGWRVHVVKADPLPDEDDSPWRDQVKHPNIEVHSLPRGYPQILSYRRRRSFLGSLVDKIRFRVTLAWVRSVYPGTPYDISLGWEPILLPCLKRITDTHPVQWMFATGAPWDMLRVAALHKKLNPQHALRLWVDFRDPWLLDEPHYGMANLSPRKYREELAKARVIMDQADVVSAPYQPLLDTFVQAGFPLSERPRSVVLPHYYVPSDSNPKRTLPKDGIIRIVYGGTVYSYSGPALEAMAADLDLLRVRQPEIYARFRIDFYTSERSVVERIFASHPEVRAHAGIGLAISEEVARASWFMILAYNKKNYPTTKYYEFQPLGTPYLHVGESLVENLIVAENRGLAWRTFIAACIAGEVPVPTQFSQQASPADSLDHRVGEIEAHIESIG